MYIRNILGVYIIFFCLGVGWNNLEKIGKIIYVDVLFGKVISEMVLFIDLGLFDMCLD